MTVGKMIQILNDYPKDYDIIVSFPIGSHDPTEIRYTVEISCQNNINNSIDLRILDVQNVI